MKIIWIICLALISPAYALTVDTPLPDPALEARAKALFTQVRCVVCAGEAIADSPAEVARDMRREVRGMIAKGHSNDEIKELLVTRYGAQILMAPPMADRHLLIWLLPLLLLAAGVLFVWRQLRRKGHSC